MKTKQFTCMCTFLSPASPVYNVIGLDLTYIFSNLLPFTSLKEDINLMEKHVILQCWRKSFQEIKDIFCPIFKMTSRLELSSVLAPRCVRTDGQIC